MQARLLQLLLCALLYSARLSAASETRLSIIDSGAIPDGVTLNTAAIQATIDTLAGSGGGTVIVPAGVFVSGALDLKPGVNLHLAQGAVLKCTTEMEHFPSRPTRIEGQLVDYTPALLNVDRCDGFRLTGEGTLDGAGRKIWDDFWTRRRASLEQRNFSNRALPRARLAFVSRSRDVVIEGVTFKDSQFWNLHLYRCQDTLVRNVRFQVPDDYKHAPSTDGIDIDSSQGVTIVHCDFSVTDDCIAAKGTKGPFALNDKESPPVERIQVRDSTFRRGGAVMCLGSEATLVRDILVEDCRVTGSMPVLLCKLRSDTPQTYENLEVRGVTVDNDAGVVLKIAPWTQYIDLKGQPPPQSSVRNIVVSGVKGRTRTLAFIEPNAGQTAIDGVTLRDIDVAVRDEKLKIADSVSNLRLQNVLVNGKKASPSLPAPTLAEVAYGQHPAQVLDFWKAPSDKPTPLVFYIHGGGWSQGDKRDSGTRGLEKYLAAGISVVSINYRFTTEAHAAGVKPPVEWPMHDAARALQFVRSKAAEWGLDKRRVAVSGSSAGACTSLWLAFHPDLADPTSADLVARESTRPWCAAVQGAQTSLDPRQMKEWTPNSNYGAHAFGFGDAKDRAKRELIFAESLERRTEVLPWIREYSPIEHATADDPPIYLIYDAPPALGQPQKDPTHTANFGVKLKEKLDRLGVGCELAYPGAPGSPHPSKEAFLMEILRTAQ